MSPYKFVRSKLGAIKRRLIKPRIIPLFDVVQRGGGGQRILVIRLEGGTRGLMALFVLAAGWVDYALKNGYMPVVDMRTFRNMYHGKHEVGKVNVWDIYFRQPMEMGMDDIPADAEVTFVTPKGNEQDVYPFGIANMSSEELLRWQLVAKRYLKINPSVDAEFRNLKFENVVEGGVLGVLIRGTDYNAVKPAGHTIQPSVEQVIEKIYLFDKEQQRELPIYLTTEDLVIERRMMQEFGDRVIVPIQEREEYKGGFLSQNEFLMGNHRAGATYAKLIFDLSRCQYLIGGQCNGTNAARLLGGGSRFTYFFNLGTYPGSVS